MSSSKIILERDGKVFSAHMDNGHCIAIPLDHTRPQPNAFFAPLYEASPHKVGDWIGDTQHGASVNFFNLRINPHGNGTHTECVGHISKARYSVHQALGSGFWIAQLMSVYPVLHESGDRVIEELEWESGMDAIIIRSMPNYPEKMNMQYGGTNPPYLNAGIAQRMAEEEIKHLLLDLPSIDREEDGGLLAGHKAFWQYPKSPRLNATITEMIYVDNVIPDGIYLLEIQLPAIELDAAPSRPFIFPVI